MSAGTERHGDAMQRTADCTSYSQTSVTSPILSFSFFANAVFVGFAGWCMELFIYYQEFGRIYDCGFLLMPWCPIYAVGIYTILFCVRLYHRPPNFLQLALISGISITALEAVTGILFRQFGLTLWNYSRWPLSNRYISLPASIGWSFGGALYLSYIYPLIAKKAAACPTAARKRYITLFFTLVIIDYIISFSIMLKNGGYHPLY